MANVGRNWRGIVDLLAQCRCIYVAIILILRGGPAWASIPSDCPYRDAPFSTSSIWIDLMLSPAARAVIEAAAPRPLDKVRPVYVNTKAPSLAAIVTFREISTRFMQLSSEQLALLDRDLRALPVTAADRAARCERYDNDAVSVGVRGLRKRILVFEKVTGYHDELSIRAARAALLSIAEHNGWTVIVSDKGGVMRPRTLRTFDAVVWNNVSGDVLTLAQRAAFQKYVEQGGGYLGIHGSVGDPVMFWGWYADRLVGARFMGHPSMPQFQNARLILEARDHPVSRALPKEWTMKDEWYSFRSNPRTIGATVILTLDEASYEPHNSTSGDLRTGDHPIAWTNCIGKGRMFYSAIGHLPESYSQPQHRALLESALCWVMSARNDCGVRRENADARYLEAGGLSPAVVEQSNLNRRTSSIAK